MTCGRLVLRACRSVLPRLLAALLLAAVATPAWTAGTTAPERRSGYDFMSRETRAMQDDDAANPGMLWVLDGEALWNRKAGAAGRACADCHGDARASMKGVAARYPAFDAARGRPVNLEQRINLCRTERQQAPPLAYESKDLLALTAYVARQSRGLPIAIAIDERTRPFLEAGREAFHRRQGQLNLSCAQCHERPLGQASRRQCHPAGAPHRLPALPPRVAGCRLAAAAAAQLPRRDARASLRLRRPGTGRSRAVLDVARARDENGDAGREAVNARSELSHVLMH